MTAFPDLNPSNDPKREKALQAATDKLHEALQRLRNPERFLRLPPEDARKTLGTRRKDN